MPEAVTIQIPDWNGVKINGVPASLLFGPSIHPSANVFLVPGGNQPAPPAPSGVQEPAGELKVKATAFLAPEGFASTFVQRPRDRLRLMILNRAMAAAPNSIDKDKVSDAIDIVADGQSLIDLLKNMTIGELIALILKIVAFL